MNKLKKGINYYKEIKKLQGYFPKNLLYWQLTGKILGQLPNVIGEKSARKICEKRHVLTRLFLEKEFNLFLNNYNFKSEKKNNNKIIWMLWLQGYKAAPEIVRATIDNAKKYAAREGFEFKLLDEKSLYNYIEFPEHIMGKINKGLIRQTALADMSRVALLAKYGGTWIDSTVFISPDFDSSLLQKDYFTIKTGEIDEFSPNISKNRWKSFLLSGNSELYKFSRDFFFEYYKKFDFQVDYLLIDYIFDLAYQYSSEIRNQMLHLEKSNPNLFWLEKHLGSKFDKTMWGKITKDTKVFKTTYKLSNKIKFQEDNFYFALINKKL